MAKMYKQLREATDYIKKMYARIYKKDPILKFHRDRLEYLLLDCWCFNGNNPKSAEVYQLETLCKLIMKCTYKFPKASYHLIDGIIEHIPLSSVYTPELCWYHGYFSHYLETGDEFYVYEFNDDKDVIFAANSEVADLFKSSGIKTLDLADLMDLSAYDLPSAVDYDVSEEIDWDEFEQYLAEFTDDGEDDDDE